MRSIALAAFLGLSVHSYAADIAPGAAKAETLIPFDRAPVHLPKNTPEAAAKNLAKAKIPEGFTADIWASEPLLANPVAFCFDPAGRMFVAETHRLRSSVLDIRHYMFMLEDDLASRNQGDWLASIKKNFPKDWQELGKETEVIRLVQDSNGDGKADQSSIYADGLNSPLDGLASGVLWDKGGLYLTSIPSFWKLTGKDKAEKREEIHRGYGVRFSYTGHDFHGLIKGPDGRIYFSIGDRGSSIKTKEGTTIDLPDEGAVFRCEPDGSRLEVIMRGLRNPEELAFDDYGNLFTGDNDSDQGDRERWVYVVEGADAGWRIGYQHHLLGKEFNPWLAEHMWEPRDAKLHQPAYVLSPIANLPDGPSGLVHYPGTGLPEEYAGSYFLAGYKGSTAKSAVNTFKSVPNGASFRLEGLHVFMDNVQATDVDFGPDSRFYVSAWDEGWERSDQGRIYVLTHAEARKAQAAQIAEVQKLLAERFEKKTPEELVKLLAHADQRVRLGAQWALAEAHGSALQQAAALALLASVKETGVANRAEKLAALHALWAIGQLWRREFQALDEARRRYIERTGDTIAGEISPASELVTPAILALLTNKDPEFRAQVARFLGDLYGPLSTPQIGMLEERLKDDDARVRFFAAMALAKKGSAKSAPAILDLVRAHDGREQYIEHACIMALAGMKNMTVLAEAAKDPKPSVRLAALLAYRKLGNTAVADFLRDQDPALVREAAIAINDVPIPEALPALADLAFFLPPGVDGPVRTKDTALALRELNANFRFGDGRGAAHLVQFAAYFDNESVRLLALEMLAKWANPPARDFVVGTYRPLPKRDPGLATSALERAVGGLLPGLLADSSEKILIATCDALTANGVKTAAPNLLALLKNEKAPKKGRLAALAALGKLDAPQLTDALAIASESAEPALKTEAAKLLGKRDPAASAKLLADAFAAAAIPQKKQILVALGENPSADAGQSLAKFLADFPKIPAEAQLELLEAAAKRPEAKVALTTHDAGLPASDSLAKFLPTLLGGDKNAGEKLFKEHAVAACLRCHKVGGAGGDAGPGLDGVAKRHDRRYLLESVIDVNAKIADGFQMVVLSKNDGSVVAGLLKKETPEEYTLENPPAPGVPVVPPVVVKKADVKKRENAPSGMLPNLQNFLTPRELRDIIEYVASLK